MREIFTKEKKAQEKENIHLNQSPETPQAMSDISIYIDPVRLSGVWAKH